MTFAEHLLYARLCLGCMGLELEIPQMDERDRLDTGHFVQFLIHLLNIYSALSLYQTPRSTLGSQEGKAAFQEAHSLWGHS